MPADQPDWRALAHDLRPLTAHTVIDPRMLDKRLAQVAERGFARQCGEVRPERGCLGVERPRPGVRCAGGGTGPRPDALVREPNDELIALLREHAERLSPLLA